MTYKVLSGTLSLYTLTHAYKAKTKNFSKQKRTVTTITYNYEPLKFNLHYFALVFVRVPSPPTGFIHRDEATCLTVHPAGAATHKHMSIATPLTFVFFTILTDCDNFIINTESQ